jgi:hypothetical protein
MAGRAISVLLMVLPASAWACSCAPEQYCGRAPDPANQQQAVFVGVVREFYPQSRQQMTQLLDEFYRTHPELRSQPAGGTGRLAAGAAPDDQTVRKAFIQFLWGNSLTAAEEEQLQTGGRRELDSLRLDYRRRARLQVLEDFNHADEAEFELFTNLDGPSCGFDFAVGETYLVEAFRSAPDQSWQVSSCRPPKPVSAAAAEVDALRAWKSGTPLNARIFGEIFSRDGRQGPGGVMVQLLGGSRSRETVSDSGGRFEFTNLDAGGYQLWWGSPPSGPRAVDLTRA